MFSRSALHRPVAVMAAAALAVGFAGCGGDDGGDEGGGAYASTWNEVCTSLTSAATSLQNERNDAEKTAKGDQKKLNAALAKPTAQLFDTFEAALKKVQDLDAPGDLEDFQTKVSDSIPSTLRAIREIKGPVAKGDAKAFQEAFQSVDITKPFPALPADLKKQAAACSAF